MRRNNPDNDSVQLVFCAPGQFPSLAGREHGRTIPLPEVARHEIGLTAVYPFQFAAYPDIIGAHKISFVSRPRAIATGRAQ